MGTAGFDREEDSGRASGRRPTSTSPPGRSGRGCTRRACGSSRWSAGPSAAATARSGTATRSRGSTSPGAPARAWSRRSSAGCAQAVARGLVTFAIPAPRRRAASSRGRRRRRARRDAGAERRGARPRELAGVVADFELRAQAVIVTSGGIGGNHDLVRRNWPARLGTPPEHMITGVPGPRGRTDAGDHRGGRRQGHQPRPDVALRRGHPELEPDLAGARHPHPARAVVAVARRDRQAAAGAAVPRLRHAGHARAHHRRPATTTAGSCSPRRSSRRSSRSPAPSRTPT